MEVDESPAEAPTAQTDARETDHSENEGVDTVKKTKLKSDRKDRDAPSSFQHEVGRSAFPITRVQKILKADKELPIIAREAVFAISVATEEFIKQICSASQKQAEREKRTTVQKKDLVTVSKRAEEYWFLEDVLLLEPPAKQSKKEDTSKGDAQEQSSPKKGPLDLFAKKKIPVDS